MSLPVTLSVWPDLGKLTGMGRNGCYRAVARGDVPSARIGGRTLVLTAPLLRVLGIYPGPTTASPDPSMTGYPHDRAALSPKPG